MAATIDEASIKAKTNLFQLVTTSNGDETPTRNAAHSARKVSAWCDDMKTFRTLRAQNSVTHLKSRWHRLASINHELKHEDFDIVREFASVCAQVVRNSLYFARNGRPDVLWTVGTSEGAVTKRSRRAKPGNVDQLQSLHCGLVQYCHVGDQISDCKLDVLPRRILWVSISRIQKTTSGGVLCIFGDRTFVPISWTCKKQTAVSHGSAEADIFFS